MGILRSDRVSGLGGANAINGSVRFDKDGYLYVDSHSDWSLDGDFTIECWVKRDASGAFADNFTIGDSKESTGLELYLGSGGAALNLYSNNGAIIVAAAGSYSASVWHHLAVVRSGSTIKLYVDGTVDSNTATNTATFSGNLYLGAEFYNNPATPDTRSSFYMSNFRIVKGTALYTANFTVPAQRLENISGTAILCCQSPGDVIQEATGKTIVPSSTNLNSSLPYASHIAPDKGEDHGTTFEDNIKFDTLSYMVPPGGTTAESNRGRGFMMGGGGSPGSQWSGYTNLIDYITIQSMGIAKDFGDLTNAPLYGNNGICCSSTRGIQAGGFAPTVSNVIQYVTIATTSNATDFGDLTNMKASTASLSSQTRGIFAGGDPSGGGITNSIDYITIATTGNSATFGDLNATTRYGTATASPTRGIVAGGMSPTATNTIEYVTIATTGDATNFGDMSYTGTHPFSVSNKTRGIIAGSSTEPNQNYNTIDYLTIATTGNTLDFGDLTVGKGAGGSMSNSIRGLFGRGEYNVGSRYYTNAIDYITIETLGNAADFGDSLSTTTAGGGSDSHGGIS